MKRYGFAKLLGTNETERERERKRKNEKPYARVWLVMFRIYSIKITIAWFLRNQKFFFFFFCSVLTSVTLVHFSNVSIYGIVEKTIADKAVATVTIRCVILIIN